MPAAESDVIIEAPIDHVFKVITDYERYPEFLPDMQLARVVSREGETSVVDFELELMMRISYTLRLTEAPPDQVTWVLERAKLMQENVGGWKLTSTDDGHTHAVYRLEIKLRGLIPKSVSTRLIGETLPETLGRFKERAEALLEA